MKARLMPAKLCRFDHASIWIVSVPEPKPTPAWIAFSITHYTGSRSGVWVPGALICHRAPKQGIQYAILKHDLGRGRGGGGGGVVRDRER